MRRMGFAVAMSLRTAARLALAVLAPLLMFIGCSTLGLTKPPSIRVEIRAVDPVLHQILLQVGRIEGAMEVRCDPRMTGELKADQRTCDKAKLFQPLLVTLRESVEKVLSSATEEIDVKAVLETAVTVFRVVAPLMGLP